MMMILITVCWPFETRINFAPETLHVASRNYSRLKFDTIIIDRGDELPQSLLLLRVLLGSNLRPSASPSTLGIIIMGRRSHARVFVASCNRDQ